MSPTVNMEAIACGTPVLTFHTGGSPETIPDGCGITVACDDIDALEQQIKVMCEQNLYDPKILLEGARQFDRNHRFAQYIELYQQLMQDTSKSL